MSKQPFSLVRQVLQPAPAALAAEQASVVTHRGSPIVVQGGPGTGKTTVLVEAALARIQEGQNPDSILLLTYGRERASELRDAIALRTTKTMFEPLARTFHSLAFSPEGEAKALEDLAIHEKVERVPRGESAVAKAVAFIKEKGFPTVAINSSASNEMADGSTHSQHEDLIALMGSDKNKLVSSEELVYEWLSIKLPEEVEILKKAAQLASDFQEEAYATIVPGKTTDADVAKFLKAKMAEYGVTDAWHPDQNPNVNSGPDRGHSHATDKIIQPGDVIQTDFGVKLYGIWVSDIQRFAYVLKEGETSAPKDIQTYWENGKAGSRIALAAMKPGVKGEDVDRAQRDLMDANGSLYVPWSTGHPVGYVAHDVGPNLGGARIPTPRPAAQKLLKKGMTFAFDGFHCWKQADGTEKTISVEEMAVVNENGATYLIPPQEELILVGKK